MKIYVAGVMQGSLKGQEIQGQGYRQVIRDAVSARHPDDEIVDPFSLFPDSAQYDEQRATKTLFALGDESASADVVIAYLPEASMGTAMEMVRAYDRGKTIISISSMEKNWFIRAVSAIIFPSLDDFCAWIGQNHLAALTAGLWNEPESR